jgi:thioredoxin 1
MAIITIRKFSKPNCRPCAALANYIGDIDLLNAGATLVNVDITEHPEVIDQYRLTSVPVLVMERNGVEVGRIVGLVGTEEIVEAIEFAKVAK